MFGDLGFPKCQMEEAQAAYGFFPAPKKRERKKKDKMHKLKSNLIFQSRVSHVGNSFRAFWRFFHVRQNIVFLDNKSTKPKVGGDVFFYQKKEMKAFSVLLESGWFHQKQKVSEQKAENLFIFFFFVCKTCQSKTATCMLTCFCNTLKCKITRTRLRKGFWCQFNNYRYTTKDMPGESRWLTAGLVLHVSALLPFFFFFFWDTAFFHELPHLNVLPFALRTVLTIAKHTTAIHTIATMHKQYLYHPADLYFQLKSCAELIAKAMQLCRDVSSSGLPTRVQRQTAWRRSSKPTRRKKLPWGNMFGVGSKRSDCGWRSQHTSCQAGVVLSRIKLPRGGVPLPGRGSTCHHCCAQSFIDTD